jgi:hypothetical protein
VADSPLTFEDIRDFMQREWAKPYRGPVNCLVLDSLWRDRIYGAFTPEIAPRDEGYMLGDMVMGLDIYLDETYPEPIFRNRAEYLAEVAGRQPERKRVVDW